MEKISEWSQTTEKKMIIYALREAVIYQKMSMGYIDGVLRDWKNKGITVEQLEK